MEYTTSSITKLSEIEHIRQHPGMYIGDVSTPKRLIVELIDNAADEALAGHCDQIEVFFDTKKNYFYVQDNGRGLPFDQSLNPEDDPPILICISSRTSGKFKKSSDKDKSVYSISAGAHGIGNSAVYALSDKMEISVYNEKKKLHGIYKFKHDVQDVDRSQEKYTNTKPYATKVTVYPSKKYFTSFDYDFTSIEENLRIVAANCPNLSIKYTIDNKTKIIKGTEDALILDYLGKDIETWHVFDVKKGIESCYVKFGWDTHEEASNAMKCLSTVNLVKVDDGSHINKFMNSLKTYIMAAAEKNKFDFQPNDVLVSLRLYMNLKIVKTSFESQVKTKLSKAADISVMDKLDKEIETYFKKNNDILISLLEHFHEYRKNLRTKKIIGSSNNKKRGSTRSTKLMDCTSPNGELIITEGDSAAGGLKLIRDTKKHAVLPLKGVIANAVSMSDENLLKNLEIQDIINACGCGIEKDCNIERLRYEKIIIQADSDPAGSFISALCIILFAKLMPDVIKAGRLYIGNTPLYGYGVGSNFVPLWSEDELEKARKEGKKIKYYKGLGSYSPEALKTFVLDNKARKLDKVDWTEKVDKLFELFDSAEKRLQLVLGKWKITD